MVKILYIRQSSPMKISTCQSALRTPDVVRMGLSPKHTYTWGQVCLLILLAQHLLLPRKVQWCYHYKHFVGSFLLAFDDFFFDLCDGFLQTNRIHFVVQMLIVYTECAAVILWLLAPTTA